MLHRDYINHYRNFLAIHGIVLGLAAALAAIMIGAHPVAAGMAGITLGLAIAVYKALHAPGDLTDWQIALISETINPYRAEQIEPDSYDVLLGTEFCRLKDGKEESWSAQEVIIEPGECLLAHTQETFRFPKNTKGILQGKSSWARLSLFVECAGLFDKGFEGTAVLELFNASPNQIRLKAGDRIAQMSFHRTLAAAAPYGGNGRNSHYQNQSGARASWLSKIERVIPKT